MGLLISDDAVIYQDFFKEMAKLRGIRVKYQYIIGEKEYTIHSELKGKYSEPVSVDIVFEEYPKQRTLRRHGWFSEDRKDDTPYLAHVPHDIINLEKGCLLWIPSGETGVFKPFRVEDISTIIEFPASLTVKLAPFIPDTVAEANKSYQDSNSKYLKSEEGED